MPWLDWHNIKASAAVEHFPTLPELPWDSFGPRLVDILVATYNRLDREWPAKWHAYPNAQVLMEGTARTVSNTYHTIRILSSDKPQPPIMREDALSVGPLSRTILDSLFMVIFVFHDLPARAAWYWKSGWRSLWEGVQRYIAAHGSDPAFSEWIALQTQWLDITAARYGLTVAEIANPKLIRPWWPHPGGMLKDKSTSPDRLALMRFLNDWYYGGLSSESHLSLSGLVTRSAPLIPGHDPDELEWRMDKQRSDNFLVATFVALAFASEIEIECRFGSSDRLKYVWTVLAGYAKGAKTLYDKWYSPRL